ncbi:expressed unknown protein [Seminavis robusta]|uniref:Uncharacterized protein n=1 Tax=Seminavis robusta TaxID=568900 RepID=A0A9N8EC64_9STRA|nr:expressed unknown protein [Seminavis robusta]|eukprot:Sro909_g218930.1 n/a (177) ;mRNA; r:12176-12706
MLERAGCHLVESNRHPRDPVDEPSTTMAVQQLENSIEQNIQAARRLLDYAKQQEDGDFHQESEIIALQPHVREHLQRASEACVELRDMMMLLNQHEAQNVTPLARFQCEIEGLRKERTLLYSRCRKRHTSVLISYTASDDENSVVSRPTRSSKKRAFWRLRNARKQLKQHFPCKFI